MFCNFVFKYDFAFKSRLILNCLISYLCLNNNIVSCLCHVVLSLIFRFCLSYFTCHVIFVFLRIFIIFLLSCVFTIVVFYLLCFICLLCLFLLWSFICHFFSLLLLGSRSIFGLNLAQIGPGQGPQQQAAAQAIAGPAAKAQLPGQHSPRPAAPQPTSRPVARTPTYWPPPLFPAFAFPAWVPTESAKLHAFLA